MLILKVNKGVPSSHITHLIKHVSTHTNFKQDPNREKHHKITMDLPHDPHQQQQKKKAAAFYEIIPNVYLLELPELIVKQQQGFVAWRSLAQCGT